MDIDRIKGGFLGHLVADALGASYEFKAPSSLPPIEQIEMVPPTGFRKTYESVPIGTFTDDGSQALVLLETLLECEGFNPADSGSRLVRWASGYLWVDGHVFDVGGATRAAISKLRSGTPPLEAGGVGENSNGNGSLMRVLPVALWHQGSDADLVRLARDQSRVTHGHLRSQVTCALYCLWARALLEEVADAWSAAVVRTRTVLHGEDAATHELESEVLPDISPSSYGRGYVVSSLHSARKAMEAGPYEAVVKAAVAMGYDTNTTACIAGGLAGIRDGFKAIPERWLEALRGRDIWEPILDRLLQQEDQR